MLTGSAADAEDIVQACFLELLRPNCSYDPDRGPLRNWLFGVARNQALKQFRQSGMTLVLETSGAHSPEHEILRGELEHVARRAVLTLPEPQRVVLILAHYEQLPLAEVAAIIGIEVGAVKSRLQRARTNLSDARHVSIESGAKTMNDTEIDELLDIWKTPPPPVGLQTRLQDARRESELPRLPGWKFFGRWKLLLASAAGAVLVFCW